MYCKLHRHNRSKANIVKVVASKFYDEELVEAKTMLWETFWYLNVLGGHHDRQGSSNRISKDSNVEDILKLLHYAVLWPVLNGISIPRSPAEIPFWALLFVGIPYGHYLFVPWPIMTSQYVIVLLGMSIVISQWDMMLLWAHIMMLQCILMLLGPLFMY